MHVTILIVILIYLIMFNIFIEKALITGVTVLLSRD